jgi:hypothetical protein
MSKLKKEETTSTELVVITPEEQAYLESRMSEEQSAQGFNGPKRLCINEVGTDENGNKVPIGGWHIRGTDMYFDGEITFRPVRKCNTLVRYNEDFTSIAGSSVYFVDYIKDEILDSLGGVALGRKFGKRYTDEQKEATRKLAEVYMDIFGFVRFGKSEEQIPVVYRVRGTKMMQLGDAFDAVPKDKKYFHYEYKLSTYQPIDEKTKKPLKYWSIKVSPQMDKVLSLKSIMQFDTEVNEFINEHNKKIIESHKRNRERNAESQLANEASAKVINAKILPAELDDELPF